MVEWATERPLMVRVKALSQVARMPASTGFSVSHLRKLILDVRSFDHIHLAVIVSGQGNFCTSTGAAFLATRLRSTLALAFLGLLAVTCQMESINCSADIRAWEGAVVCIVGTWFLGEKIATGAVGMRVHYKTHEFFEIVSILCKANRKMVEQVLIPWLGVHCIDGVNNSTPH